MMQLLRIPKASENLETATVGRWLKAEGDNVAAGEPIVEILTDKADFALEAEEPGRLRRIVAVEKSTVPVGYVVGIIAAEDEHLPDVDAENLALVTASAAAKPADQAKPARTGPSYMSRKIAATPAARRLAKEHGVDLAAVAAELRKTAALSADDVTEYLRRRGFIL
ncbi:MAG TPA: biotin/lipoyl-containing protein [Planctomycetota bacterium]|nr:biotin/lipoyl-containing protein [Planctomycetota bacterium]